MNTSNQNKIIKFLFNINTTRQICKVCGLPDYFNFNVPDKIWQRIVPRIYQNKVVCLPCFDRFATIKNINYAKYFSNFLFVGDKAYFTFKIIEALDN
ncbi:hypothetical protein ES703_60762 [subsurface metagenome]